MASVVEKLNAGGFSEKKSPLLESGFHLSSDEFHARYKLMPEETRAELIEGIVYMASPVYMPASTYFWPRCAGFMNSKRRESLARSQEASAWTGATSFNPTCI